MKIHRFIGDFDLSAHNAVIKGEAADQIRNVLRMQPGDEIVLCDGRGSESLVLINRIGKGEVAVDIMETSRPKRELDEEIVLFAAVIKKENFELVVQKAVECGVIKIVPIITERTVKLGLNMERMTKIIREAAEQSERTVLPEIVEPVIFSRSLEVAPGEKILFHPEGEEIIPVMSASLSAAGTERSYGGHGIRSVSIFVGPEGGFSEREAGEAAAAGARIVSLGKLILRAETAAIIASYVARYF